MWYLTIIINCLILFLFWMAGFIAISPAYNHFVQYAHVTGGFSLPILTDAIFTNRLSSLAVPGAWLLISIIFMFRLNKQDIGRRREMVQLHSSTTIFIGLLLFVVSFTAGILPYLKIGVLLD